MAHGVIPVATPVGDIPRYLTSNQNGFVTSSIDAAKVVEEMTSFIQLMNQNSEDRSRLSKNSYEFAKEKFSQTAFEKRYQAIFYS